MEFTQFLSHSQVNPCWIDKYAFQCEVFLDQILENIPVLNGEDGEGANQGTND